MKTFKDLEFKDYGLCGVSFAMFSFPNNYQIVVQSQDIMAEVAGWVRSQGINTYPNTYSIFVGCSKGKISHTIDNVSGYCNKAEVTKIMKQIQKLGKNKRSKDKVKT